MREFFSAFSRRYTQGALGILCGLLLIAATLSIALFDISLMDLDLWDETVYLDSALRGYSVFFGEHSRFGSGQYGPLYLMFYKAESLFCPDPVRLFYCNFVVTSVLVPVCVYICLLAYRTPPIVAAGFATVLLYPSIMVTPRPSHLVVCLLMLGLAAASGLRTSVARLSLLLLVACLASLVRPEMSVSAVAFAGALAVTAIVRSRQLDGQGKWRRVLLLPGLAVAASAAMFGIFGFPLGGGRSMVALKQHVALNWVVWHKSALDPWLNCDSIFSQEFGGASSVSQAVRANPAAFVRNVEANLGELPTRLTQLLIGWMSLPLSEWHLAVLGTPIGLGAIVLLLLGAGFQVKFASLWIVVSLTAFLLPGLVAVTVVYPRAHYLLEIIPLLAIMLATCVRPRNGGRLTTGVRIIVYAMLTVYAARTLQLAVHAATALRASGPAKVASRPALDLVGFARSLRVVRPVVVLEEVGDIEAYLGPNFTWVNGWDKAKDSDFAHFVVHKNVGMVIVDSRLTGDLRFSDDPSFQQFVKDPSAFGFELAGGEEGFQVFARGDVLGP